MDFLTLYVVILIGFGLCFIVQTGVTILSFSQVSLRQKYPLFLMTFMAKCGISFGGFMRSAVYIQLIRLNMFCTKIALYECFYHVHGIVTELSFFYHAEMSLLVAIECLLVILGEKNYEQWWRPFFSWYTGVFFFLLNLVVFWVCILHQTTMGSAFVYNHCKLQLYSVQLPMSGYISFLLFCQTMTIIICTFTVWLILKKRRLLSHQCGPKWHGEPGATWDREMNISLYNLVVAFLHLLYYGITRYTFAVLPKTKSARLLSEKFSEGILIQDLASMSEMFITVSFILMTPVYSLLVIFFRGNVDNIIELGHALDGE
ncbi:unnamed protein product [Soboliphyme baturini]|uniref:G_PROTEIN_RECEP_F1_2 domain-containing protein n=1 Tax=Soboliphyme baturini TaxID=241478 RepID=A0A183IYI9_9BILA|nr:unnamed protein product [Soboliphyme baturini]